MNIKRFKIKKGFDDLFKSFDPKILNELKRTVLDEWDRQKQAIERVELAYSKMANVSQRHVKTIEIPEKNAKITFRPSNGEILIKIPVGTPLFKIEKLEELAATLTKELPDNIPTTLRGTPHWSESERCFNISLVSNSKNFKFAANNNIQ